MAEARAQRRLAAILAADVVGYSRLMRADETGTLAQLKTLRTELLEPKIAEYGGRVVKTTGDGILIEFPSAVDAVHHAVEVQVAMKPRNASLPQERRMEIRIGINVGDVVVEDGDLFGDGVNVAARMEGLAKPGGICISGNAYEQVRHQLDLKFEDAGEHQVKNLDEPVRVYRIAIDDDGAAQRVADEASETSLSLPDKPSIAVLPFDNLSGDPDQDYFADGMVEEIITALSRLHWLFVIARNSTFTYKGKAVDVRQVARDLGVRYVLEGSVRKAGNRVRISGQLIDALTGTHLWADRYDGNLEDVFDLQDQITECVVGELQPKLRTAEIERAGRKRPGSMDAYDYYLRALPHVYAMAEQDNELALDWLGKALAIDPNYAPANACAAWCYEQRVLQGFAPVKSDDVETGVRLARAAIEAGREDPEVLAMAGFVLSMLGHEHESAIAAVKRSLSLNPNSGQALGFAGWVFSFIGDQTASLDCFESAMRLSPNDPLTYSFLTGAAMALLLAGKVEEAVSYAEKSAREYDKWVPTFRYLAASYAHLGQTEKAQIALRRILELDPHVTIARYRDQLPFADPEQLEFLLDGLRKAGLPE